jgi:hypothetical protein
LESLLKHFSPPNRLTIFPPENKVELFIYIVHFILSRHFDFGREVCLDLMQAQAISTVQSTRAQANVAPERTAMAVQATLLSLRNIEREESTPAWPSSSDFSALLPWEDYPTSSELVPASLLAKPGMQEYFDRCGSTLAPVVTSCSAGVGNMSIFGDQWSLSRLNPTYNESHNFVVRRHSKGTAAYPSNLMPQITVLQIYFQS